MRGTDFCEIFISRDYLQLLRRLCQVEVTPALKYFNAGDHSFVGSVRVCGLFI